MRRKGHAERQYEADQKMKNEIAKKQWMEVFVVLAIFGGAITFLFIGIANAMGVL